MHPVYFDGVEVPFNYEWKNVAISVSGGADSALLAYFICSLATEKNITVHIINHVRCWKTKPWQQHDADYVYKWLRWKFHHVDFERHINFIAPELEYAVTGPTLTDEYGKSVSGDNIQQRAYAEYICNKYNINAYYNAVTRNPRGVEFQGMTERDIEPNEKNKHLAAMQHLGRWALHPFRFVEKDWVIQQYYNHGLLDLLNKTRSCEGEVKGLTYENYKPGTPVPTCGECFWCKEREWAIANVKQPE